MKKSDVLIPIQGTKARWPRDGAGDPNFQTLEELQQLFSLEQIVVMANRYLRQQEYQSQASQEWQARKRQDRKRQR